jgi:hypothetical protein
MKLFLALLPALALMACTQPVPTPDCIAAISKNEGAKKGAISRGLSEDDAKKLADKVAPMKKGVCTDEELDSISTVSMVTELF